MKYCIFIITFIFSIFQSFGYNYSVSEKGYELIKSYESCKLTKYKDSHGYSIGWGHLIKNGETYTKISQKTADDLFKKDIQWVNEAINRLLKPVNKVKFSQNFIDALGDLIYNCGETGVKNTTFYKRLLKCRIDKSGNINTNDFNFTVAAVLTAHVYEKGHKTRRYACHLLMIK